MVLFLLVELVLLVLAGILGYSLSVTVLLILTAVGLAAAVFMFLKARGCGSGWDNFGGYVELLFDLIAFTILAMLAAMWLVALIAHLATALR